MTQTFIATLCVTGAGRLAGFAEFVRALMVRDIDAGRYTEHHREGILEYRFEIEKGIPFPAFVSASAQFPELRVDASWDDAERALRRRARIENGRLTESAEEPLAAARFAVEVTAAEDGELRLALACRAHDGRIIGYAAGAARHAYCCSAEGVLRIAEGAGGVWSDGQAIDAQMLEALEELAFAFAEEWLWYDEAQDEAAQYERARFADSGRPVRGANLRSQALARLRQRGTAAQGELRYSELDAAGRQLRDALLRHWGAGGGAGRPA